MEVRLGRLDGDEVALEVDPSWTMRELSAAALAALQVTDAPECEWELCAAEGVLDGDDDASALQVLMRCEAGRIAVRRKRKYVAREQLVARGVAWERLTSHDVCTALDTQNMQLVDLALTADALPPMAVGDILRGLAANGKAEVLTHVHALGIDLNTRGTNGMTPVASAAEHHHSDVVTLMHSLGADVNAACDAGYTPLGLASQSAGHAALATVRALLAIPGTVVDAVHRGMTPLHEAARAGNAAVCEALLRAGADVERATDSIVKTTPLGLACDTSVDVCAVLVGHGARVNTTCRRCEVDGSAMPPLAVAAGSRYGADVCALLISHGADVEAPGYGGLTPLMCAAASGHGANCRLLLDAGASIDAVDKDGRSALLMAASAAARGDVEALYVLLDRNADVRLNDNVGHTALMLYVSLGTARPAGVRALVYAGADPNAVTASGTSVLRQAYMSYVSVETMQALVSAGADVAALGIDGLGINSVKQRLLRKYLEGVVATV